jgi:hypothetical protein
MMEYVPEEQHTFVVPTYLGGTPANLADDSLEEFGKPDAQVMAYRECGVRLLLGIPGRDFDDCPDIKVERRTNGWAIFLHPMPMGDPSGYVYFIDDGRSVLIPDPWESATIEIRSPDDKVPEVDTIPQASGG